MQMTFLNGRLSLIFNSVFILLEDKVKLGSDYFSNATKELAQGQFQFAEYYLNNAFEAYNQMHLLNCSTAKVSLNDFFCNIIKLNDAKELSEVTSSFYTNAHPITKKTIHYATQMLSIGNRSNQEFHKVAKKQFTDVLDRVDSLVGDLAKITQPESEPYMEITKANLFMWQTASDKLSSANFILSDNFIKQLGLLADQFTLEESNRSFDQYKIESKEENDDFAVDTEGGGIE